MRLQLDAISVITTVTATALFGMFLGGAFGYVAGGIAPDFFAHTLQFVKLEPRPTAVVLGAVGGVLCGGGLGAFAVAVQAFASWTDTKREQPQQRHEP